MGGGEREREGGERGHRRVGSGGKREERDEGLTVPSHDLVGVLQQTVRLLQVRFQVFGCPFFGRSDGSEGEAIEPIALREIDEAIGSVDRLKRLERGEQDVFLTLFSFHRSR
jgi:hypothetical protein